MNAVTDFDTGGQITQSRAEKATEWMVHNATNLAEAKAHRDYCENMLRVTKALVMKSSDQKSAAAQEREAYASDQYHDALREVFDATLAHETLLARRNSAQAVIEVWRSLNSSLRGARV